MKGVFQLIQWEILNELGSTVSSGHYDVDSENVPLLRSLNFAVIWTSILLAINIFTFEFGSGTEQTGLLVLIRKVW
jgi:hypothetical protein